MHAHRCNILPTYTYTRSNIHLCTHVCICTGLKIGSVISQNANHFWGNCETLCQSESQYCESF